MRRVPYEQISIGKRSLCYIGADTELAVDKLKKISVSLHCRKGDGVKGFDTDGPLTGGIQTTGIYPGRARTPQELMADMVNLAMFLWKHVNIYLDCRPMLFHLIPIN